MSDRIPVSWHLHGEVNSQDFTLSGAGIAEFTTGTTELELTVSPVLPAGFDLRLTHMICNFPLAGYVAVSHVPVSIRDAVVSELFVRPRRQVIITDASGEHVTRLEALTTMQVLDTGISITSYLTGFSKLLAPVAQVIGEEALMPGPRGTATGVARYTVSLQDDSQLDGMTVVPYAFDRQEIAITPARRVLASHSCDWISASRARLISTSEWVALTETAVTGQA